MEPIALLIAATMNAGTVLAIASLGLLINERAGIVNLGAEGMMLVAAIAGFATGVHTGNDWLAFAAGAGAGAAMALVFGVLVIWLNTNQYASGLALSLFGVGFSAFVGIRYTQERLSDRPRFEIPGLADLPFFGSAFFKHHPMVYFAIVLTLVLAWFSTARVPASCCAPWASRPSRPMHWAIRCGASACWPCWPAARCAAWPGPTSRSSTPRCGWRA